MHSNKQCFGLKLIFFMEYEVSSWISTRPLDNSMDYFVRVKQLRDEYDRHIDNVKVEAFLDLNRILGFKNWLICQSNMCVIDDNWCFLKIFYKPSKLLGNISLDYA